MKKLIINADDFGYSKENNEAIKLGYESGLITSSSIITNTKWFEHAIKEIIPSINNPDLGFHFNIMEGKSITNPNLLCDSNGFFNNSYLKLILKSNDKMFLNKIEHEFRAQIEKILQYYPISHIDSHVHTHAIPCIFKLITKLAAEYKIKYIRTQKEIPYFVLKKLLNKRYPANIIKNILLNNFSKINAKKLKETQIKTNDYFIGVLYTGYMDCASIIEGLKKIVQDNSVTEVIFHPYFSKNVPEGKINNYNEFLIINNPDLIYDIKNLNFTLSKYSDLM